VDRIASDTGCGAHLLDKSHVLFWLGIIGDVERVRLAVGHGC
jgi:hypothetical protein